MSTKQSKDDPKSQRSPADKQSGSKGSSQQSDKGGSEQSGSKGGAQSGTPGAPRQSEHEHMERDIKRQTGQNTPGRKVDDRPE